jgi:Nucleoporin FG repeat region
LFGQSSATSIFGATTATTHSTTPSIFGQPQSSSASIFGSSNPTQQSSLFGQPAKIGGGGPSSIFGSPQQQPAGIFGSQPQQQQQQQPTGLFGQQQQPSTGLFGQQQQQAPAGGIFGGQVSTLTTSFSSSLMLWRSKLERFSLAIFKKFFTTD